VGHVRVLELELVLGLWRERERDWNWFWVWVWGERERCDETCFEPLVYQVTDQSNYANFQFMW